MVAEKRGGGLRLARPIAEMVANDPEMLRLMEEASDVMAGAQTIRSVRKAAGLSQTELADRLHVSQARVCEMEAGRGTAGVSYALLLRAVRACGFELAFTYRPIDRGAEPELAEADDDRSYAPEAARPVRVLPAEADLTTEEGLLRAIFGEDLQPDPNAPAPVASGRGTRRRRGRRIQGYERAEETDPEEPGAARFPDKEPEKDQLA